jgi:hypothetical protein
MVAPALLTEYLMTVLLTRLSPRILVFTPPDLVSRFTPGIFRVVYSPAFCNGVHSSGF